MNRSRLVALLLVPLAVLLLGAIPLEDPPPISVPANLTLKEIDKAIRVGLSRRDWMVTRDEGQRIDATLHNRSHVVKIALSYSKQDVRIMYVDSENMDYEEKKGVKRIHKAYKKWIQNTSNDITSALQNASLDKDAAQK